jgi:hypothetical protein
VVAPKDGFTLGCISSNHVINPGVYKNMPLDSLADITPLAVVGTVPLIMVVNPQVKARTTRERRPDEVRPRQRHRRHRRQRQFLATWRRAVRA